MKKDCFDLLLADDDADDCSFFKRALEDLAIKVNLTIVNDGEQLMRLLSEKEDALPDVLYLDLNMPRKNGFDCLLEIKQNEKLKQLPVIIFSTSFDNAIVNLLHEKGGHYYICKPREFYNLRKVIGQSLKLIAGSCNEQPSKENFVLTPI